MAGIYETFYKLTTDPFRLSPDHRFSFGHSSYKKAKAYMQYALQRGEGFIMVTGSPGTGKTTLINDMLSQIDDKQITVVSLLSTRLKPDDMLHMVATSLGISCDEARKSALLVKIKEALTHQHRAQRRVVLMVDEAQDLSEEVVEELRLLSNMQMGINLLLQVFLVGQEPLVKLVKKPDMEHLRQRIIAATHLDPLSIEDTAAFIVYRLKRAGWKGDPVITSSALESIYRFSGGIPRRINLICSRLLFFGAVEEKHTLDKADIDSVVEGMQEEMLFGEGSVRPQPDATPQAPKPDRGFAQRVRGAGSLAYAVPDKALEEPDPAVPLSDFFDVVADKPEDLVMEVVPTDLNTDAMPGARVEPQMPEQLLEPPPEPLFEVVPPVDVDVTEVANEVTKDFEPELTAEQESVVIADEPVTAAAPISRSSEVKEARASRKKRPAKSRSKGWGGFFLSLVFIAVVASAAFVFFKYQEIERLDLYERLTAWLEDQGVSFVLPLKDPNEPGTAPRSERRVEPNAQTVDQGQGAPHAASGLIQAGDSASQPGEGGNTPPDSAETPETPASMIEDAMPLSAVDDGVDPQPNATVAETEADRVLMEQSTESEPIPVDPGASVENESGIDVMTAESPQAVSGIADTDVKSDVAETDSSSVLSPLPVKADEQMPEIEETQQAQEPSGVETSQSVSEKKDVEVASLITRSRISEKPIGELAVLKTGPERIPASIPSAFTSGEGRDYSLVEIRSQLKSGRWGAFGEPAALLPSTMNHCKDEGVRILCWTAPQQQEPDGPDDAAVYQIESTMDGFSSSGTFEVRYRIMETAMNVSDYGAMDESRVNVKPGWEVSEYETLCRIVHSRLIRCYGGDEGVFSYTSLR